MVKLRILRAIKKPITGFEAEMGSGYRRIKLENRPAPTPQEEVRHHQALRRVHAVDMA
jgi:hypothetical protein